MVPACMQEAINPNILVQPLSSMAAISQASLESVQHNSSSDLMTSQQAHDPTTTTYVTSSLPDNGQVRMSSLSPSVFPHKVQSEYFSC